MRDWDAMEICLFRFSNNGDVCFACSGDVGLNLNTSNRDE